MKTSTSPLSTDGPRTGEHVALVDPSTGRPLRAVVDEVDGTRLAVRFAAATRLRGRTRLRWFDGEYAWEAAAAVHGGSVSDHGDIELLEEWQCVPVRGSERVPVDRFPLLVEVVHSNVTAKGRRFDMLCHDVSATGCAATAPGKVPAVGDMVRVAWVRGDEWARIPPEWIDAEVTRAESRPFGGGSVGLRFDPADAEATARILAWRDAWAAELAARSASEPVISFADAEAEAEPEPAEV